MRLTDTHTSGPLPSHRSPTHRSPTRHTHHPVAWRQSLTITIAFLLAFVVGAAPASAKHTDLPQEVARIKVGPAPLGIAIAQNRGTFAFVSNIDTANPGTVSVINTKTRTVAATIPVGDNPSPVVASTNGRFVYVGTEENIAVIDTSTFQVVRTIGGTGDASFALAISPNGRILYADPGGSGPVKVFDAQSGALITQFLPNNGHPGALAVSPNGQRLYVGVFDKPFFVDVFDTKSLTLLAPISVPLNPLGIRVTPNGRQLYVTNWGDFTNIVPIAGNTVQVFDTGSLKLVGTITVHDYPSDVAFTPNGQLAYVVNNDDNTEVNKMVSGSVSVVQTRDLTVLTTVLVDTCPTSVAVTPNDGHDAYVTNTGEGATCAAQPDQDTVSVLSQQSGG